MDKIDRRGALGIVSLGITANAYTLNLFKEMVFYSRHMNGKVNKHIVTRNCDDQQAVLNNCNTRPTDAAFLQRGRGAVLRHAQDKLRDIVSVRDFGAIGNGVSDDTISIQAAIDSLKNGGILLFPSGQYKISDEIIIPPVGGLIIQGSGSNDNRFGAPVPSGSGTFIFQDKDDKAIFCFSGGCSYSIIRDMTLSATKFPSNAVFGSNRFGIKIEGTLPEVIWSLVFENIVFFNFSKAISCIDVNSTLTAQDMSVAPVSVKNCVFLYCAVGVYINTNNADFWIYDTCFFFIPAGGIGVELERFGLQYFFHCSGGGLIVDNNRFIKISPIGATSVDKIIISGCQTEKLKYSVDLAAGGIYKDPFVIELASNVFELGSDIYLGSPVNIVSQHNRFSGSSIYIDNIDVKISTINDQFSSSKYVFLSGSALKNLHNTVWGPNPPEEYSTYKFEGGRLLRFSGITTDVASATATTLFALPTDAGLYEVFAYFPKASCGGKYIASIRIASDGGDLFKISETDRGEIELMVSQREVRAIHKSGVRQDVCWIVQLIV